MSRMTWNAPEGRFFDTGLDRGVLYPKGTPPLGEIVATNLMKDPSPLAYGASSGVDPAWLNTRWFGGGAGAGTYTIETVNSVVDGITFPRRAKKIWTGAASSNNDTGFDLGRISATPGDVVSLRAHLAAISSTGTKSFQAKIQWTNAVGTLLSQTSGTIVSGGSTGVWQTITANGVAPAGTVYAKFVADMASQGTAWGSGDILYGLGAEVWRGPLADNPSYFDGSTPDGSGYSYAWTGADHASPSIKRVLLGTAVPWLGLTGVEESGGDGAAAYYIDGRPFLFLPKPKEYKATLKALTYPDAFAQIMGVTEVADGMYLDSQPGEAFDLSYRTLVGNAVHGVDHGYKIHLIYNATVTPQTLSYESLSNSINPTEFSWEIQAIPVKVEGFRPTAHIIIDTRHMDLDKIAEIEALIYGSDDTIPSMPNPQVVFDLLSFGDTIIVTDNGDGTYSVEGSYENVYMTGPGIFRVDNVDATDHGDGTFTISTTIA